MFSGKFVSTESLQTLLDNLYARHSRPPGECVLMVFEGTYLARTGVVGTSNTVAQNTWRNNFNLQKGVGCYASRQELSSPTFLAQPRHDCTHLVPAVAGSLNGAKCALSPRGAAYRSEEHAKWLRIDHGGNGYAVADLMNVDNFKGVLAPGGRRLPVDPLIVALYHDALPSRSAIRPQGVEVSDFKADFSLSPSEFSAYFDDSASNPDNGAIRSASGAAPVPLAGAATPTPLAAPTPPTRRPSRVADLSGTPVAPPSVNSGWSAEEFVRQALINLGWATVNVSRQQLGYDLLGQRGKATRFFEVKSSLGYCSPRLTEREWEQATQLGSDYILAIIENFNPDGTNEIFWVPNPAGTCAATASLTTQFGIARHVWQAAAVDSIGL
ncbi:MAG: DUF3883 domain-containing protein [Euryarchaeota archaeon]|nr:DUF3883 domain-containing protein [Euryarchaeota archaeon]MDE1836588.1 DUF3883 domain-containing protein [Euryarchaeota archaeon]MDE1879217.1 DUF3883 domain-containing protein [Euryarchaeota archaeon]MDE2044558.1 DUF3883 domain-containing protein [Thermoplasmata archaeon]